MVVTGLNAGSFCENFGQVVLSGLTETVTVEYTITFPLDGGTQATESMNETYTPDANGMVRISDLGKLAQCYFPNLPQVLDGTKDAAPQYHFGVLVAMTVKGADGGLIDSFEQHFLYSNCRTNMTAFDYGGFLTRHRRTKIRMEQTVSLGFYNRGQTLYIGVKHNEGSIGVWSTKKLQDVMTDGRLTVRNLNVSTVASAFNIEPNWVEYYIVYIQKDGKDIDAVQFDVDNRFFPVLTHFAYYNCFGVPETLYVTGKDNRTTELNATYARIGHEYRKINTDYNVYHEVNTGYISEVQRDCVEDLINSRKVWIYDAAGLGNLITVTSVNFDESKPRTEPINVRFTYRIADESQRKCDREASVDYRIFDHTFGNEFE